MAGREKQVEGVAEDQLIAELGDLAARSSVLTAPRVASGTNAGVRTLPCASCSVPRARRANQANGSGP